MHDRAESFEVPLWRLNLLRANFLVWAVGGCFFVLPDLVAPHPGERGMIDLMLAGLWLTSFVGLRHPLLMLPIFLLEFAWKSLWLLTYGLPQWLGWVAPSPTLSADLLSIGNGPILFGLIIPWTYFWRRYVTAPAESWRRGPAA